jgi:hypothetical protein
VRILADFLILLEVYPTPILTRIGCRCRVPKDAPAPPSPSAPEGRQVLAIQAKLIDPEKALLTGRTDAAVEGAVIVYIRDDRGLRPRAISAEAMEKCPASGVCVPVLRC